MTVKTKEVVYVKLVQNYDKIINLFWISITLFRNSIIKHIFKIVKYAFEIEI